MEFFAARNRRLGVVVDFFTLILSFFITYSFLSVVEGHPSFVFAGQVYVQTSALLLLSGVISLFVFSDYPNRRLTTIWQDVKVAFRVTFIIVVLFTLFSFVLKLDGFSRLFLGTYFIFSFLLILANRGLIRSALGFRRRAGWDMKTRLIIGAGLMATKYVDKVEEQPQVGIRILGYAEDNQEALSLPYLGTVGQLRSILGQHQVDGVVIALPLTDPRVESVIDECELHGTPVELMLDSLSTKLVHSSIVDGMGLSRLMLSQATHAPDALLLKRLTDIILSGLALLVLSPVFILIAIAIKLDDNGPVFFRQTRMGQFGRTFQIHKFRSMRVDAELLRDQLLHLNEMSGPVFKITADPRITRVGSLLRKLSLDELPQFYDVFVGHMSLVGPRPPLPSEVQQYDVQHRRRLSVKPGITCLWQISGRNDVDFEQWMDLDLAYIDTWSFTGDLRILAKTIPAVLKGHGAS